MVLRANRLMRVLSAQVIMLDTLREDFPGQMYLARHLHSVTTPIITGDKANLERGGYVSSLRGPKV